MSITKLPNGKWEAKISYRDSNNVVQGERRRFKLKREAEVYEAEFKRNLSEIAHKDLTYREIFEANIKASETKILPRSIQDKRTNAETYWSHLFDKKYSKISKKDWLDIWISITSSDKSYATKNKAIKYLKSVGKFAYNYYDLTDNTKHLELVQPSSDDIEEIVSWSQEQFDTFIRYVDDYTYKALFSFYYDTGATLSETLAIKKSDFDGKTIAITDLLESKGRHRRLKNRFRKRKITLANKTIEIIQPLLQIEGDYIFGGIEPLSNRTVPRQLARYIKITNESLEANKGAPLPIITIHGFRHSHATNLINNGVNIVAVSRRLGHSDIQTTLKTYTHLLQEKDDELVNVIDNL